MQSYKRKYQNYKRKYKNYKTKYKNYKKKYQTYKKKYKHYTRKYQTAITGIPVQLKLNSFVFMSFLNRHFLLIHTGILRCKTDISARNPSVRGCFSYCGLYFLIFWTKANQGKRSIPGIGGIYNTSHTFMISDNSIGQIFNI